MTLLGVNIDHIATVRNARGGDEPDPVTGALIAEMNGADSIVCHLREDRRHIKDRDVRVLRETVKTSLQLEMALDEKIIAIALEVGPDEVMIVPERREEITTEGGFDAVAHADKLACALEKFKSADIGVSVFVDAQLDQIKSAHDCGAEIIEIHTGPYAHARTVNETGAELRKISESAGSAWELGLHVHAGHGLSYHSVQRLVRTVPVQKVNIGHAIVSRAIFSGFENAVRDMKAMIES